MARESRLNIKKNNGPRPAQKIELSERHIALRAILAVAFLLVGILCMYIGYLNFVTVDGGYSKINSSSTSTATCSNEFNLYYNFTGTNSENRGNNVIATRLYTETCETAYQLFSKNEEIEHVNNIYYINKHLNEDIVVDSLLYNSLKKVNDYDSKLIYLGDIYDQYLSLFTSEDDASAKNFDYQYNNALAEDFATYCSYINNPAHISIEFKENLTIRVYVSKEFLDYCSINNIESIVDFGFIKNAFIIDYISDAFINSNMLKGYIYSNDGYFRSFSNQNAITSAINKKINNKLYTVNLMNINTSLSLINYRENGYYSYVYSNNDVRTKYISAKDGKDKTMNSDYLAYSTALSVADVLLSSYDVYVSELLDNNKIKALKNQGIYSIYTIDNVMYYNDSSILLGDFYKSEEIEFKGNMINE